MTRGSSQHDHLLEEVLGELAGTPQGSPDLSRSIMGRLGYMRVGQAVARKRALKKWLNRFGMTLVGCVALALGWRVFESSPHVRRPTDATVPQAISNDVQLQQERLGTMLQTIRQISSPKFTPRLGPQFAPANEPDFGRAPATRRTWTPQPAPGGSDSPFTAELKDEAGEAAPTRSPIAPTDEFGDRIDHSRGQQMRDELNRDQHSPVRWV